MIEWIREGGEFVLERKCKKIIKCCEKYFAGQNKISFEQLKSKLPKFTDEDLFMCCRRLEELDYIDTFVYSDDLALAYFSPNYLLYNHKEYARAQLWEFLRKSIIVPIVVAFLTALLTMLLKDCLIPLIQSWFP